MRLLLVICCFALASASTSHLGHTQGTLTIDVLTFERILHRFDAVLVKFDDKFPFGGIQDDFKSISLSVARSKDFIIAEVPVTDRDEQENYHFAFDFQAFKPEFPIYRLFLNGNSKPIHYTGDRSADDLRRFLLRHTNVWLGLNGTVEVLDGIARNFFDAVFDKNENERDSILEKTRNLVESMENQKEKANGEVYVKIMEAVVKNGIDYFNREARRIQNLLKGKVSKEKRQELVERESILLTFKSLRETTNENAVEQKQESTNARQEL